MWTRQMGHVVFMINIELLKLWTQQPIDVDEIKTNTSFNLLVNFKVLTFIACEYNNLAGCRSAGERLQMKVLLIDLRQ